MENSAWRVWAKVVAYVEIVLLICIDLLVVLCLIIVSAGATAAVNIVKQDPNTIKPFNDDGFSSGRDSSVPAPAVLSFMIWIMWALAVMLALMTAIQLWAAFKLLSASEVGKEPQEALGKARFWRNVTIVFLALSIVGCLATARFVALIIVVLWRGGVLFVVYNFMKEMEDVLTGQSGASVGNNIPVHVIVKQ